MFSIVYIILLRLINLKKRLETFLVIKNIVVTSSSSNFSIELIYKGKLVFTCLNILMPMSLQ